MKVPIDSEYADGSTRDIVDDGMERWQRERPDIDCSGKAVVGRILRLQDVILTAVNDALSAHGLTYSSYAVLATLRSRGAPFAMSPSELTHTLLLSSGGLSNLLSRLEKSAWVTRLADPDDGRGVIVRLSAKGRRLADRAMGDHAAVERKLIDMFSKREQGQLADLLRRMLIAGEEKP